MRIVILLSFLTSFLLSAQEEISYAWTDSTSYASFIKQDWKQLKSDGKRALDAGVDFFYLRLRMGIAYYSLENYEAAFPQFEVAYQMNPADTLVQEYLYYSYLLSNRIENAQSLASSLSPAFQEKVSLEEKRIDAISVGAQAFTNKNISSKETQDLIDSTYNRGETILNGSVYGATIALESTAWIRTHFYNKFSIYQTNSLGMEQFRNPEKSASSSYTNMQYQYNWGLAHISQKGYLLSGGVGVYKTRSSDLTGHPLANNNTIVFDDETTDYLNWSGSISAGKRFKYVYPILSLTMSNLYDTKQLQGQLSLSYFPFGNNKLIGTSSLALINNGTIQQQVINQKIGVKCTSWLFVEGRYSLGNHSNYIADNGFTVYNTADPILSNIGIDIHLYQKKVEWILGYSFQSRQSSAYHYINQNNFTTTNFSYNSNNLTATFKWNF